MLHVHVCVCCVCMLCVVCDVCVALQVCVCVLCGVFVGGEHARGHARVCPSLLKDTSHWIHAHPNSRVITS